MLTNPALAFGGLVDLVNAISQICKKRKDPEN
jgi:hypothetical protein